jgi:hypothetical protein
MSRHKLSTMLFHTTVSRSAKRLKSAACPFWFISLLLLSASLIQTLWVRPHQRAPEPAYCPRSCGTYISLWRIACAKSNLCDFCHPLSRDCEAQHWNSRAQAQPREGCDFADSLRSVEAAVSLREREALGPIHTQTRHPTSCQWHRLRRRHFACQ